MALEWAMQKIKKLSESKKTENRIENIGEILILKKSVPKGLQNP